MVVKKPALTACQSPWGPACPSGTGEPSMTNDALVLSPLIGRLEVASALRTPGSADRRRSRSS